MALICSQYSEWPYALCSQYSEWPLSAHSTQNGPYLFTVLRMALICSQYSEWPLSAHSTQNGPYLLTVLRMALICSQYSEWPLSAHSTQNGLYALCSVSGDLDRVALQTVSVEVALNSLFACFHQTIKPVTHWLVSCARSKNSILTPSSSAFPAISLGFTILLLLLRSQLYLWGSPFWVRFLRM